ncbi:MAG: hypothetical protein ACO3NW_11510 [Kiritimatiellia bacterium]
MKNAVVAAVVDSAVGAVAAASVAETAAVAAVADLVAAAVAVTAVAAEASAERPSFLNQEVLKTLSAIRRGFFIFRNRSGLILSSSPQSAEK